MGTKYGDEEWEGEATTQSQVSLLSVAIEARPSVLRLVQGPGAPRDFLLLHPECVVGRGDTADIPVASTDLSRKHMVIKKAGEEFSCTDLESRNGVYLNGVKIHSAVLREGDTLQLGNVVFLYHEGRR